MVSHFCHCRSSVLGFNLCQLPRRHANSLFLAPSGRLPSPSINLQVFFFCTRFHALGGWPKSCTHFTDGHILRREFTLGRGCMPSRLRDKMHVLSSCFLDIPSEPGIGGLCPRRDGRSWLCAGGEASPSNIPDLGNVTCRICCFVAQARLELEWRSAVGWL